MEREELEALSKDELIALVLRLEDKNNLLDVTVTDLKEQIFDLNCELESVREDLNAWETEEEYRTEMDAYECWRRS